MSGHKIDRRDFLAAGTALVASGSALTGASLGPQSAKSASNMVGGYSTTIPGSKVLVSPCCGSMVPLKDGRIMLVWGATELPKVGYTLQANYSSDGGRTWSDPGPLKTADGSNLRGYFCPNLARLKSGKLGLLQVQQAVGFNDASRQVLKSTFHISEDEGKTWSRGIPIPCGPREFPYFDQLNVLSNGRLMVPFHGLIGPTPKPGAQVSTLYGEKFTNERVPFAIEFATVYYSDDEGATWKRSFNEVFASEGLSGGWSIHEFCIAELADGRILLMGHSGLRRVYRAYSEDHGETWLQGEPSELQDGGPVSLKRIPGTDDVLLMWVQMSSWEQMNGLYRHRLSSAITSDGGKTFHSFKNLESLDDVTRIETEALTPQVQSHAEHQPLDRKRYRHAPGPLRCDHPFCTFHDGNAIIGYGVGVGGDPEVITRFYGESWEHFNNRFGFVPNNEKGGGSVLGTNKIRVVPINEL